MASLAQSQPAVDQLVAIRYEDATPSTLPVEVSRIRPGSRSKAPNLATTTPEKKSPLSPLISPKLRKESREEKASTRRRRNSQSLPTITVDAPKGKIEAATAVSSSEASKTSKAIKPAVSDSALPQISLLDLSLSSEPFLDLSVDDLTFSKRGSVMFGGQKAFSASGSALTPSPTSEKHSIPVPTQSRPRPVMQQQQTQDSSLSNRTMSADEEALSKQVRELYRCGDIESLSSRLSLATSRASVRTDEVEKRASSTTTMGDSVNENGSRKSGHEMAGGFEDWENLTGQQVDRYGFIVHSPSKRTSTSHSASSRDGRDTSVKNRLRVKTPPSSLSRKFSKRSLKSAKSGKSTRSSADRPPLPALIYTKNKPRGKARRTIAGAGDMLTLPPEGAHEPGLTSTSAFPISIARNEAWIRKEAVRANKWRKMAQAVPASTTKGAVGGGMRFQFDANSPLVVKRVFKGIPDIWRASAWMSFMESSRTKHPHLSPLTEAQLRALYHEYASKPSPDDTQIDLDVPRTLSGHVLFRRRYRGGQRLLFRVLHAFSLFFPQLGYVQGMASLASTLLCYYDEEETFIMLVRLFQLRGLSKLYEPGFGGLLSTIKDFEKHWLGGSDLGARLESMGIDGTAYATRWFLTSFSLSLPFAALVRVWDVWMLLGEPVLPSAFDPPALLTTFSHSPSNTTNSPLKKRPLSSKEVTESGEERERGFDVLFATALSLVDAMADTIRKGDFEAGMKGLTGFFPVGNDDMLMAVVEVEWNRGKR